MAPSLQLLCNILHWTSQQQGVLLDLIIDENQQLPVIWLIANIHNDLDQHYEQEVHQHLHHQGNTQAQCHAAEEDKMFFCCKTKQNLMN